MMDELEKKRIREFLSRHPDLLLPDEEIVDGVRGRLRPESELDFLLLTSLGRFVVWDVIGVGWVGSILGQGAVKDDRIAGLWQAQEVDGLLLERHVRHGEPALDVVLARAGEEETVLSGCFPRDALDFAFLAVGQLLSARIARWPATIHDDILETYDYALDQGRARAVAELELGLAQLAEAKRNLGRAAERLRNDGSGEELEELGFRYGRIDAALGEAVDAVTRPLRRDGPEAVPQVLAWRSQVEEAHSHLEGVRARLAEQRTRSRASREHLARALPLLREATVRGLRDLRDAIDAARGMGEGWEAGFERVEEAQEAWRRERALLMEGLRGQG